MALRINPHKCPQNHRCPMLNYCQAQAISQDGYELPVIDDTKCIECGKCAMICPRKAVEQKN